MKVMNDATCPLLLIAANVSFTGIKNILYAYNDIDLDRKVINNLVKFAKQFNAHIHLVHVSSESDMDDGFLLLDLLNDIYPKNKITLTNLNNNEIVFCLNEYANNNDIDKILLLLLRVVE